MKSFERQGGDTIFEDSAEYKDETFQSKEESKPSIVEKKQESPAKESEDQVSPVEVIFEKPDSGSKS